MKKIEMLKEHKRNVGNQGMICAVIEPPIGNVLNFIEIFSYIINSFNL